MPAPATVDEFVDLIRKSAVLEEARLSAYVDKLRTDPTTPRDLSSIAGLFVRDGLLTFFQAEQFLQGKWKRFTIGKYKVLERLGSGGMGQVFLCEHKLMRRRVAVKVLPTQKAADPSSLDRFYREARAVAALDHPNIVRAYDIDQDDNLHFLVMEYVDGASLQEMIRKTGPMDPVRACHYMYWSAVGLQHAHSQGLIHRDVKPGNILVDRTGVVKILDLGLARFFLDEDDLITKKYDESVLGTADYLAPEQAIDSHTVDGRADIYSLGATFYFLLTGQPPFAEGTVAQKLLWHQTRSPKPIREVRPEVPDAVARIVARMMNKKPEDRYQNPGELAEAFLPFTQTPIPPPPEEEMPVLSAAAMGTSSGPASVPAAPPRSSVSAPRTPPPGPGPKATATATRAPRGQKPPPRGNNGVAPEPETQKKANPVPVVEPIPDSSPGAPLWDAITAETANNQRADTDRKNRDGSSRRVKTNPKSALKVGAKSGTFVRKPRLSLPLILTIVGAVLLIGAAGTAVWFNWIKDKGTDRKGNPPTNSDAPRKLGVSRNASGPLQFNSIRKAADDARSGDTIVIEDLEWEESVAISRQKNLTIEGAAGRRTVWRAPANKADHYILSLAGTEGFRVQGIVFEANPRVDHAVRLGGACPGLVLENVDFVNGKVSPLVLHDCVGDKARPATIRNCRVDGKASPAGIVFKADVPLRSGPPGSPLVLIERCLVEAPLTGVGIQFEGSAIAEVRNCRIWKGTYGVQFKKLLDRPGDLLWQVSLTGNTFHSQSGAAVRVEDAGQVKSRADNRIALVQNFFASTAPTPAIRVDGDTSNARFLQVDATNWCRAGTPPIVPDKFPIPPLPVTPADVSTDASKPDKLLTYPRSSPLFTAADGKPAGAPPD